MDDSRRIAFLRALLARPTVPDPVSAWEERVIEALLLTLFGKAESDGSRALARLWQQPAVLTELDEVLGVLEDRAEHETRPLSQIMLADESQRLHAARTAWEDIPLSLHARYSLDEVTAAIGRSTLARPVRLQGGVLWDPTTNADYFFITLEKSEKHYSPTTRYRDYALSPEEFHWESQAVTLDNEGGIGHGPALHQPSKARLRGLSIRPPDPEDRRHPHRSLHLPRPSRLCSSHRRNPHGHHLAPPPRHATGCVQAGAGGGGVSERRHA